MRTTRATRWLTGWALRAAVAAVVVMAAVSALHAVPSAPATPTVKTPTTPAPTTAPPQVDGAIAFGDDLAVAIRQARAAKKPTFVYFSSPTCQWCRRMQVTSFTDRTVKSLAAKFVAVKIDASRQGRIAALFRVQGLPHVAVLDWESRLLTSRPGYMPPDVLVAFLRKALVDAGKGGNDVQADLAADLKKVFAADEPTGVAKALRSTVEWLAEPDPAPRESLLTSISDLGPKAWPGLCELMKDKRLAVRTAAAAALIHATKHDLPFDAFAPLATRRKQIAAWQAWVKTASVKKSPASRPAFPKAAPKTAPAKEEPK